MKTAFSFLFFLAQCALFSQTWGPDTRWIYDQDEFIPSPGKRYLLIRHEKDTLIQGFDCDQFMEMGYHISADGTQMDSSMLRQFILRWQNEKVWFYEPEDSNFHIVYNFSLGVGDTLYSYGSIPGIHAVVPLLITDISTTQIGAKTLKVQHVTQLEPASFNMYGALTEEIGCIDHLLPRPGFVDPAPGGLLLCYVNNGFQYPETGLCKLIVDTDEPVSRRQVQVSPNPATQIVTVGAVTGESPEHLQLFNFDGRILAVGTDGTINVSQLPSGVYLLKITWPGAEVNFSKLIRL